MSVEQAAATGRLAALEVEGAVLAVRQWGAETGRPLVFWHALGALTSGAWLTELARVLVERHGLRLVAVDGPGFGASPPLPAERYDGWGHDLIADGRPELAAIVGEWLGGVLI